MCLRTKGIPEATSTVSVRVANQVHNQRDEFVYLGRSFNHNADLSIEVDQRVQAGLKPVDR